MVRVIDLNDILVLQLGQRLTFALEALQQRRAFEAGVLNRLQGDVIMKAGVLRFVDTPHGTLAELCFNLVFAERFHKLSKTRLTASKT